MCKLFFLTSLCGFTIVINKESSFYCIKKKGLNEKKKKKKCHLCNIVLFFTFDNLTHSTVVGDLFELIKNVYFRV